ncbi:dienelactone hydrolase family protein [Nonomuraea zeae]|uniref:Dienelactone hydrolase n=1 Tax=Nonomuraea zeae TaxID=1642303 RepID=A0A5S4GJN3_9ACTN|nr:dienelactone hydrolase family protein [Nonomuraea zeae]TMR33137.1 dienelactone hydrolase [Nonomuraea zeae]
MAEIILLHSAQGLRPGVGAAAEALREGGHMVRTPDYYDGEVFDDLQAGLRKRDAIGPEEIELRFRRIGDEVTGPAVFAGFSLGAYGAQLLAVTHPAARGALLFHGAVPLAEVTAGDWPDGVPVQVHHAERDPWVDEDTVARLGTAVGAGFEHFTYPGDAHLFADPDLPGYSGESAALMWKRVRDFLSRI